MSVSPATQHKAEIIARLILHDKAEYDKVEAQTGAPWHWVGIIHYREADLNFKTHLANGDPLGKPTIHTPKGLLARTWDEGAVQALKKDGDLNRHDWGSFARYAYQMEAYNGWGYRGRIPSPYLWAGAADQPKGKFVSDGHFNPSKADDQLGGLVVLRSLMALTPITFTDMIPIKSPDGVIKTAVNILASVFSKGSD